MPQTRAAEPDRRFTPPHPLFGYLALAGVIVTFASDFLTPLGFAHGMLYPVCILLALLSGSRTVVIALSISASLLTVLGLLISPDAPMTLSLLLVLGNRVLALVAIALTALLGLGLLAQMRQLQRAQRELELSRQHLAAQHQLQDIASTIGHLGGWQYTLQGEQIIWSDEVAHIHDLPAGFQPANAEQAASFFTPASRATLQTCFQNCREQGIAFDEELELITAHQRHLWVRVMAQALRDRSGRIVTVHGALQDISERKQAELLIAQSQRNFRLLADSIPLVVWSADADGSFTYFNKTLVDYCGLSPDELSQPGRFVALLHPEDQVSTVARWSVSLGSGADYTDTYRLRRRDGHYCWHLSRAQAIRDDQGQIIRWYGSSMNIHEQKQLESQYRQLADRLHNTLESITDGFFTLDWDWNFTFINRQAEQILQQRHQQVLGKSLWQVLPEWVDTPAETQFRTALTQVRPLKFESFHAPLNLWLHISIYPANDGLVVYFQDITRARQLETQLHEMQRLESIGQLTGGIAHDFNNLLTVIMGNADLLTEQLQNQPRLQGLSAMIGMAANRGAELTRRLLAFARRQPLEPKAVDVNQLVASMQSLLQRTLGKQIDIALDCQTALPLALVDPVQLESALLNLCINARDAMPDGGRLVIETSRTELDQDYANRHREVSPGSYIQIAVSDAGTGIPPELLQQVFAPFFTTKPKGKGTGLGLSMVFGFIKQSRGHVSIYSEPGQGTTVRMYLPLASATDAVSVAPSLSADLPTPGHERILLVEDDEMVRRYALQLLLAQGYQVVEASNGPEALALLQTRDDFDLLFTDVVMPGGMTGRELADRARQLHPHLRVLYTSGYTENAIVHHGRLDAGVILLSKPYLPAELARKVRTALTPAAAPP